MQSKFLLNLSNTTALQKSPNTIKSAEKEDDNEMALTKNDFDGFTTMAFKNSDR